jgi:hypothetical protein
MVGQSPSKHNGIAPVTLRAFGASFRNAPSDASGGPFYATQMKVSLCLCHKRFETKIIRFSLATQTKQINRLCRSKEMRLLQIIRKGD